MKDIFQREEHIYLFIFRQFCSKYIPVILEAAKVAGWILALTLALLGPSASWSPVLQLQGSDRSFSAVAQSSRARGMESSLLGVCFAAVYSPEVFTL